MRKIFNFKLWFLVFSFTLLTACGGGSNNSSADRQIALTLNWSDQTLPDGFVGNYASNLAAKGTLVTENASIGPVDALVNNNIYTFTFAGVEQGTYQLNVDLYSSVPVQKIATGIVTVTIGSESNISAELASADLGLDASFLISANPQNIDSDHDGLTDSQEITLGTDPLNPDTDGDSIPDGVEVTNGTNPLAADTDGDGHNDSTDAFPIDINEWADTDRDGVGDNADNCMNAANFDQLDTDDNGVGDACADDDDGDGLSDTREAELGTDPKNPDTDGDSVSDSAEVTAGTNPLAADTDADGYNDNVDIFPLDAAEWADADRDSIGDNSDNCASIPNPDQINTDQGYFNRGVTKPWLAADDPERFVTPDAPGDACDPDLDGDGRHVTYLDETHGSDTNLGTFLEPVRSLQTAIDIAHQRGDDVYVAAGTYNLTDVTFIDGVELYGGYADRFTSRDVHNNSAVYKTELTRGDSPVSLRIENFSGSVRLDGFYITNTGADEGVGGILPDTDEYGCNQATVYIVNSNVKLDNNVITGNPASNTPCGLLINTGANIRLNANRIDANGLNTASKTTGVSIVNASPIITNNIIIAGRGEHSVGIRTTGSNGVIVNNTIDGTSNATHPQTSYGIIFDGGSPKIVNNIIYTDRAPDQSTLLCAGSNLTAAEIKNNILTTFRQTDPNAVLTDCDGGYVFVSSFTGALSLDGADTSGNVPFAGDPVSSLLDAAYVPLAGTPGVNAGLNTNTDAYGNVSADYNGRTRSGSFDIGAVER